MHPRTKLHWMRWIGIWGVYGIARAVGHYVPFLEFPLVWFAGFLGCIWDTVITDKLKDFPK